jgi:hypothetical protein
MKTRVLVLLAGSLVPSVVAAAGLPAIAIEAPLVMGVAEQAKIAVRLLAPHAAELEGRIVLESSSGDPAALFSSGGRQARFRIPANSTEATFNGQPLYVQSGGAAGELVLRAQLSGEDAEGAQAIVRLPSIAPSIDVNGIRVRSRDGAPISLDTRLFEVFIPATAPGRDVVTAEFRFRPSRPGALLKAEFPLDVSGAMAAFFRDNPGRTTFTLVIPFTVEGSLLDIKGASVVLVTASGERSNEASADSEILP